MKKTSYLLAVLLTLGTFAFTGCSERTENETEEAVESAGNDIEATWVQERDETREEINRTIVDIDREIEEADREMEKATAEERNEWNTRKRRLEDERRELNTSLERLGNETEETWQNFKSGVNETVRNVRRELDEVDIETKEN